MVYVCDPVCLVVPSRVGLRSVNPQVPGSSPGRGAMPFNDLHDASLSSAPLRHLCGPLLDQWRAARWARQLGVENEVVAPIHGLYDLLRIGPRGLTLQRAGRGAESSPLDSPSWSRSDAPTGAFFSHARACTDRSTSSCGTPTWAPSIAEHPPTVR